MQLAWLFLTIYGLVLIVLLWSSNRMPSCTSIVRNNCLFVILDILFLLWHHLLFVDISHIHSFQWLDLFEIAFTIILFNIVLQTKWIYISLWIADIQISYFGVLAIMIDWQHHLVSWIIQYIVTEIFQMAEWQFYFFKVVVQSVCFANHQLNILCFFIYNLYCEQILFGQLELVPFRKHFGTTVEEIITIHKMNIFIPSFSFLMSLAIRVQCHQYSFFRHQEMFIL